LKGLMVAMISFMPYPFLTPTRMAGETRMLHRNMIPSGMLQNAPEYFG